MSSRELLRAASVRFATIQRVAFQPQSYSAEIVDLAELSLMVNGANLQYAAKLGWINVETANLVFTGLDQRILSELSF